MRYAILILSIFINFPTRAADLSNNDIYQQFQEMKKRLMNEMLSDNDSPNFVDDFFSDSKDLMKDLDTNLFKSFGFGANLSGDMFRGRWQDEKNGKAFFITPQKKSDLKIEVKNGFININATQKSPNGQSSSQVSMNVPSELDWKKHQISKKGEDIMIFFPYLGGGKTPTFPDKKEKSKSDDDTVPIVPMDNYDVI